MTQLELKLTNSNSGGCITVHRAHKLIVFPTDYTLPDCHKFSTLRRLLERVLYANRLADFMGPFRGPLVPSQITCFEGAKN